MSVYLCTRTRSGEQYVDETINQINIRMTKRHAGIKAKRATEDRAASHIINHASHSSTQTVIDDNIHNVAKRKQNGKAQLKLHSVSLKICVVYK
ncbi:hypothetical protein GJ496_003260 [Pomphorhynchus laevis]|nr:hypothetical protein GJ496_003260 [Pomphorhynchus laevis]